MRRSLLAIATLIVVLTSGCASPLTTAIRVSNELGAVASTSGADINATAARAEHACLWRADGTEVQTSLAEQKSCVASVRATYAAPLKAYDDFDVAWVALSAAVHAAEAAEVLGRTPDLTKLEALITAVTAAYDAAAHAAVEVSK